jgi:metal-responsive CopG/Arc/MetJ family transcriptional regulator
VRDPFIGLHLPADLLARVDQLAQENEQTRSGVVRLALRKEVERSERDQAIAKDNVK